MYIDIYAYICVITGEGNGNPLQCSCLENPRQRSLVGGRLWGHTELDTTEATQQQQQQHNRTGGEGNGNPLQYSCLENPGDRGAWWASVSGVAQSWTRLKRLSIACMCCNAGNILYVFLLNLSQPLECKLHASRDLTCLVHAISPAMLSGFVEMGPKNYKRESATC